MNNPDTSLEIPRVTCALFGAIKAVATLKKTVVLVHGPRGCVYHINYILGMRGDRHNSVFSTCMNEHDVVFGAEDRLRNAIEELDHLKGPDMIVVLSCCASGIIGEDLESACRAAQTRALVIPIEAGGFSGDFSASYAETLLTLVSRTVKRDEKREKGTVNLVGMLRGGPDLREIRHLLSLIGLSVGTVIAAGATIEDLRNAGRAELNIVMCETSGLETARFLEETFGTPWISVTFPVGTELSLEFLSEVSRALGLPPVRSDMIAKDYTAFNGRKPAIALFTGPTRAIALARFLRSHNISPRIIVLDFSTPLLARIRADAGPECEILVAPGWETIEERLVSLDIDLIIGGLMERTLSTRLGIPMIDVMHGSQKTAGVEGGKNILSMINNSKRR